MVMRVSQPEIACSSKGGEPNRLGARRKKSKRLDAIGGVQLGVKIEEDESELRRSSRVRRPVVVLDVSPPPPKKRRRKTEDLNGGREVGGSGEGSDGWKCRLRSRAGSLSSRGKGKVEGSPRGKRKLYKGLDEIEDGVNAKGKSTIVKSKRFGRVRATVDGEDELHGEGSEEESEERGNEEGTLLMSEMDDTDKEEDRDDDESEVERVIVEDDVNREEAVAEKDIDVGGGVNVEENMIRNDDMSEEEQVDGSCSKVVEEEAEVGNGKPLEEKLMSDDDVVEPPEVNVNAEDLGECVKDGSGGRDNAEVVSLDNDLEKNRGHTDGIRGSHTLDEVKHLEDKHGKQAGNSCATFTVRRRKVCIKEGRRCGLCGGGTDGKPPKKLVPGTGGSDHEPYSGSSESEEPEYDTLDGFGEEPGWLGRLLGPVSDRYGIAGIWVHQQCAVWSPEVYFAGVGCLKNIRAALCRGRALKCTCCGRPGATTGCRVDRCPRTYHLPCARASRCIFNHRKFLIACTDHRHLFQPHGLQRIKKLKAKKMKLELKKQFNDAWRKDHETEEKWLEKCGEDEEFLKREAKRLQRDLLRIAPVYVGGSNSEGENMFEGWESVAGLQDVVRCMKEVVILPLLYPEFFDNMGLTPPRGVLLHGYPGTGKTLVVRALIGSCARGDRKIAYFARKGADCLGKYVGDAERQLRLLFQVAEKCQPSVIFFDEIDGLAPVRSRQQDQTHSSVVSTLLALMDGLKSRGSVVVIGATNRPDAVDPALRRPGRFDREIYFPLPKVEGRASILALHTRKWPKPLGGSLLQWVARQTVGFAGADLQALCTQAAMTALKRSCPLQKILLVAGERGFEGKCPQLPSIVVEERDWLDALSRAPPPCSHREAGTAANEIAGVPLPSYLAPCLLQPLSSMIASLYLDQRIWVPPLLLKAGAAIKSVITSSLLEKNITADEWWRHAQTIVSDSEIAYKVMTHFSSIGILVGDAACAVNDMSNEVPHDVNATLGPHSHDSAFNGLGKLSFGRKEVGYRMLIAGYPRSGQRHLASCLLHCFIGNMEIHKIDMATISQEGHGDALQGITQILNQQKVSGNSREILMQFHLFIFAVRCASVKSCVLFLPRIDLWAVETCCEVPQEESLSTTENLTSDSDQMEIQRDLPLLPTSDLEGITDIEGVQCASQIWSCFAQQVEALGVSSSFILLATSDLPYSELPSTVRHFFESGSSTSEGLVSSQHAVPRITMDLEGKVTHETMIHSCASELARDLVKQFIQLVYHKTHPHEDPHMLFEGKKDNQKDISLKKVNSATEEPKSVTGPPEEAAQKIASPSNSRVMKGRSSLLMAITCFGYQILSYPHFAELCWVTSKLKDGPFADIHGPWKGWPFNSCIVRPGNTLEGTGACISSSTKGKEQLSLARGLIAVGLSAYRGVYTSLFQVSLEVRKVLELLVGEISTRIQAGKDRCQFVRLLSQAAYLEDMVNSWVHSLRSLDVDAQTEATKPKLTDIGSANSNQDCPPQVSMESSGLKKNLLEAETVRGSVDGIMISNAEPDALNKEARNVTGISMQEAIVPNGNFLEGEPVQGMDGMSINNAKPAALDIEAGNVASNDMHKVINLNGYLLKAELIQGVDGTSVVNAEPDALNKEARNVASNDVGEERVLHRNRLEAAPMQGVDCTSADNAEPAALNKDAQELPKADEQSPVPMIIEGSALHPNNHENGTPKRVAMTVDSQIVNDIQESDINQACKTPSCEKNGALSETFTSNNHHEITIDGGSLGSLKQFNGFADMKTCVSGEYGGLEIPGSSETYKQPETSSLVENGVADPCIGVDANFSSERTTRPSAEPEITCSYSCCFECVNALKQSIQKVVTKELELTGGCSTVEEVHDFVGSLSSSLCSAVRKLYVAKSFANPHEQLSSGSCRKVMQSEEPDKCTCKMPESEEIVPRECTCHPGKSNYIEVNSSAYDQLRITSRFTYKDGVLIPSHPDKDLPSHCKYENFCLCSLTELIVSSKQL